MPKRPDPYGFVPDLPKITVRSTDVDDGADFSVDHASGIFGAGGSDVSPQLSWSGLPSEARSVVVTCFDPDAPVVSGFWHWAVTDIPATVAELPRDAGNPDHDAVPAGALTLPNDAGLRRYLGAAPPAGDGPHRYIFAVHAVDVETLGLDPASTPAFLSFQLLSHALARGLLTATYEQ